MANKKYLFLIIFLVITFSLSKPVLGARPNKVDKRLKFTENKGQWDHKVLFRTEMNGGFLFLEPNAFTYVVIDPGDLERIQEHHRFKEDDKTSEDQVIHCHALKLHFDNTLVPSSVTGVGKQEGYCNYFIGDDPSKWASGVGIFTNVQYKELYPGINMRVSSKAGNIKYEFEVAPGKDPSLIRTSYEGAADIHLVEGNLFIRTSVNEIIEQKPFAYQLIGNDTIEVPCSYVLKEGHVSFSIRGNYKRELPLVIDPVVVAATYAGSSGASTYGHSATYDKEGNIYVAGRSFGMGYPVTVGAFQLNFHGAVDIALSKFNPTATSLIWATYLGGSQEDFAQSLVVNDHEELYVYGSTQSNDYPHTPGCFQNTHKGLYDIVITHLNASGTALKGSTYIGGSQDDGHNKMNVIYGDYYRGEIILDAAGNPCVASFSSSSDFPVTTNAFNYSPNGGQDGVVFAIDSSLSNLLWSTYIGGSGDDAAYGIMINSAGKICVTGGTTSPNFPVTNGIIHASYIGGTHDAWVSVLNNNGSGLIASTYYGTTGFDESFFIDLDAFDNIFIYGITSDSLTPSPGVYSNPGSGQFIAKLSPNLHQVLFQTVFGNGSTALSPGFSPTAFMVDNCSNIYAAGWGATTGFPVTANAIQPNTDGADFYLLALKNNATQLSFATFYGSTTGTWEHVDGGTSRFDKRGVVYQAVCEGPGSFPCTSGAYRSFSSVPWELAVFKIDFQLQGPRAQFSINPSDTGCTPFSAHFINSSINAGNYLWNFGDGSAVETQNNPTHIYADTGTFKITLVAIDSSSCYFSDTAILLLTMNFHVPINIGHDTALCNGQSINIGTNCNGCTYLWSTGATTPIITPGITGTYLVTVYDQSCILTDSVKILFSPTPLVDLGHDCILCQGDSLLLDAGNPGSHYLWSTGSTSRVIFIHDSGQYMVLVDQNNCFSSDTIKIGLFDISVHIGNDTTLCPGDSLLISSVNSGYVYHWSTGDTTQYLKIGREGKYWLTVHSNKCQASDTINIDYLKSMQLPKNIDLCGLEYVHLFPDNPGDTYLWSTGESTSEIIISKAGKYWLNTTRGLCMMADTTEVRGIPGKVQLVIPNVITPNSDGLNDFLYTENEGIVSFHIIIFDRWGIKLFEGSDSSRAWDANYKGTPVPAGVYYYLISYSPACWPERMEKRSGSVTVLR